MRWWRRTLAVLRANPSGVLVHVAFYGYTLIGLLRYLFADEEVTQDEIWAIGATFTVAVWLWARLLRGPGHRSRLVHGHGEPCGPAQLAGTARPLHHDHDQLRAVARGAGEPVARSVVMVQQIAGMLYVAVAVSRVVGLTINRFRAAQEER